MRPSRAPLHRLSLALFALLAIVLFALAGTVRAQDVSVTGGAVVSNTTVATYNSLGVSGSDALGNGSVYNANAALSVTNNLYVRDPGILNANAYVTVGNQTYVEGRINLNASVLTTKYLTASENGAIVATSGGYSAQTAYVNTTLTYGPLDRITDEVFVGYRGRLEMSNHLSLTGRLNISDGGSISRPRGSQFWRISARELNLFNYATTFDLHDGDEIGPTNYHVVRTGATLNIQTGQVTMGQVGLSDRGSLNVNASLTAKDVWGSSNARITVNAGGSISATNGSITVSNFGGGASLALNGGSLSTGYLSARGSASFTRSGGSYTTRTLDLSSGAATSFQGADAITHYVQLSDGGTLTLNKDLPRVLGVALSGSTSSIVRNGPSISAQDVQLESGAKFVMGTSDAILNLTVSGSGSVVIASQPISVESIILRDGGVLSLESFTGTWSGAGGYALAVPGPAYKATLEGYLNAGRIVFANNPGPVAVVSDFDASRSYIVSATAAQTVSGTTSFYGAVSGSTSVSSGGAATFAGQVTGTVTVGAGGQATFAGGVTGAATITGSATVQGVVAGSVSAANGGVVVVTGSITPTAQVSVGAGSTVSIGNGAAIAQPTLTNAGKFAVANTGGTVVVPTAITGTGSFEKTGAGSVQLTGSSNFTGGSTIASGQVVVQNGKALGSGGVTVSSGGKLLVDGVDLNLGGAAVSLVTGAELRTTSGARVTVSGSSDLSGVRSTSPAAATAAILAGTSVSGTLATTWSTSAAPTVKSEVLELKTPTSASNPFVLSLTYAAGLDPTGLFLGWNDPVTGAWVNAVVGNELLPGMTAASGGQRGYFGSFSTFQAFFGTNLSSYLGAYGRDDLSRTVWAVVNHNSEFAVTQAAIPEPGALALAIAGLAGAGMTLRRRKPS